MICKSNHLVASDYLFLLRFPWVSSCNTERCFYPVFDSKSNTTPWITILRFQSFDSLFRCQCSCLTCVFTANKARMITVGYWIIWTRTCHDDALTANGLIRNMAYHASIEHIGGQSVHDARIKSSNPFMSRNGAMRVWWNQHYNGINAIISCW